MTVPDCAGLQRIATECVTLVARQFGRRLDWSLASLDELDAVCAGLLADGPLNAQRLDLWWKLTGAYTGEVLVRVYGGQCITHEQAPRSFAVSARFAGSSFQWMAEYSRSAVSVRPGIEELPVARVIRRVRIPGGG